MIREETLTRPDHCQLSLTRTVKILHTENTGWTFHCTEMTNLAVTELASHSSPSPGMIPASPASSEWLDTLYEVLQRVVSPGGTRHDSPVVRGVLFEVCNV